MTAYIITQVDVHDSETFEKYRQLAGPVLARFGGEFLVRGGKRTKLEGKEPAGRVVVIEFADMDQAVSYYNSPEYQEAKAFREGAAEAQFFVVEGV